MVGITTTTIEEISAQQQVHIASKHSTTTFTTKGGGTRFGKLRAKTGISTSGITVVAKKK